MDEGEGFPHRDSSQRDVHQPQEYQIRGMRIIQRVHFAWKRVQYLFNSGNQETVSPICFSYDLSHGICHTD